VAGVPPAKEVDHVADPPSLDFGVASTAASRGKML